MRKFQLFVVLLGSLTFYSNSIFAEATLTNDCKDAQSKLEKAEETASASGIDPECIQEIKNVRSACTRALDMSDDEIDQARNIAYGYDENGPSPDETNSLPEGSASGAWRANAKIYQLKSEKYGKRSDSCTDSRKQMLDTCRAAENRIHTADPQDSAAKVKSIWEVATPVYNGAETTAKCDKSRAEIETNNSQQAQLQADLISTGKPAPSGLGSDVPNPHRFQGDYGRGIAVDENGKSLVDKQEQAEANRVAQMTGSKNLGYAATGLIKLTDAFSPSAGAALSTANGEYANAVTSGATAAGELAGYSVVGTAAAGAGAFLGAYTFDTVANPGDDSPGINSVVPTNASPYSPSKAISIIQPWHGM